MAFVKARRYGEPHRPIRGCRGQDSNVNRPGGIRKVKKCCSEGRESSDFHPSGGDIVPKLGGKIKRGRDRT